MRRYNDIDLLLAFLFLLVRLIYSWIFDAFCADLILGELGWPVSYRPGNMEVDR